jgi:hypothetical protein
MRQAALILALLAVGCIAGPMPPGDDRSDWEDGEVGAGAAPSHDPTGNNCPGGGGNDPGGSGGEPSPIPAPRDCTREPTWEQCYACCDWNAEHVWKQTCRRIKGREERAACWRRLENHLRPECDKGCNRPGGPITTVAP